MTTENFLTRTEPVVVSWTEVDKSRGSTVERNAYGTVVGRTTVEGLSGPTSLVAIKYENSNIITWVPEDHTDTLSMEASIVVDHDGMETVEDSALALLAWLRDADVVAVTVRAKETGDKYIVHVTRDDDGTVSARMTEVERRGQ